MSKDVDGKELDVEGKAPRRRRRGGLRVPSDNVPRRAQSESTPEPPEPEDPHLAVSVAYAFGANGQSHNGGGESAAGNSVPKPLADDASGAYSAPALAVADPDTPPEARTTEPMQAVAHSENAPEIPESMIEDLEPEAIEPELVDDDALVEEGELAAATVAAAAPAGKRRTTAPYKTVEMPAIQLEALGLSGVGDSVDIPFDDDDDITYADATPPVPPEELVAEVERVLVGAPAPVVAPAVDPPAAQGKPARPMRTRAPTMALSEEDLEEVRAIAAAEGEELPELESLRQGLDLDRTPPPPPSTDSQPVALADSGDSGEILSEDLIEELDDAAQSAPVAAEPPADNREAVAESKPPPAPPKPPPAPSKPKGDVAKAAVAAATKGSGRKRKGKPWFEEIFEEDYLRTLPFLTPQATQTEAQLVAESLELEPGQLVLDVGCGYGRHAMELAARGIHVWAIDSSLPLLLRGADEAQRRGLDINFVHGDMRELSYESQFDGAYCLFSTFGYFDDETNKKTALNIARALKPGGRFVVEILNRDYIISDLPSRVWWEGDGCVVLEEVDFNYFSSRVISSRSVVFDDGRQLEQEISLRAYSLHEFGKLLHAAGFRVLEISGGLATRGRFFGNQSRDIIVLAERRNTLPT